jgi:YHS domain-containing protein
MLGAGVVALGVCLSATVAAAQQINADRTGVAVRGYDPVAYFTDQQARKGSDQITATHAGATYYFSTTEHRDAFLAGPDRYVPAYGGFCAYGVAQGHKVDIDPEAFRVVDDRLYLNYSKGVQKRWLADVPGNIARADGNWQKLRDAPPD